MRFPEWNILNMTKHKQGAALLSCVLPQGIALKISSLKLDYEH